MVSMWNINLTVGLWLPLTTVQDVDRYFLGTLVATTEVVGDH